MQSNAFQKKPNEKKFLPVNLSIIDKKSESGIHDYTGKVSEKVSAGVEVGITLKKKERFRIQKVEIDPYQEPPIRLYGIPAGNKISFPILNFVKGIFRFFYILSIGDLIRKWGLSKGRRVAVSIIDWYIISWLIIEAILLLCLNFLGPTPNLYTFCTIISCYRIFEIVQVYFNILLFDPLIHFEAGEEYFLYSSVRSILISLISYLEIILCYAAIYFTNINHGFLPDSSPKTIVDSLYFSFSTIVVMSFGEIIPINWMRFITISEVLIGLMFTVTIMARFLNFLPTPHGKTWWR